MLLFVATVTTIF